MTCKPGSRVVNAIRIGKKLFWNESYFFLKKILIYIQQLFMRINCFMIQIFVSIPKPETPGSHQLVLCHISIQFSGSPGNGDIAFRFAMTWPCSVCLCGWDLFLFRGKKVIILPFSSRDKQSCSATTYSVKLPGGVRSTFIFQKGCGPLGKEDELGV